MAIFQNDLYSIEQEEFPGCLVSSKVVISPLEVNDLYKKSLKKLKKSISIPGFRKGKVSDDVVINRYYNDLKKEWHNSLVTNVLKNIVSLSKVFPLNQQSIRKMNVIVCELDKESEVLIEFERYPEIPLINWNELSCSLNEDLSVSEVDFAKELDNIRYYFASSISLDRESEKNDYIILSLKISQDESNERFLFKEKRFKLSEEDMNEKFLKKFLGLKKGAILKETIAHKEISEYLQGNILTFIVNDVISLTLPELNDEIAQKLKAESLEDLKAKLKIQLETREKNKLIEENLSKLEDTLVNLVDFDVPESLLNHKLITLKQNKLLSMRLVDYLEDQEILEKEELIHQEIQAIAKKQLKVMFLVRKIFEQEQLSYSKEELNSAIEVCSRERFLSNPSQPPEITQDLLNELVSIAKDRLIYQKALDLVKVKASTKE